MHPNQRWDQDLEEDQRLISSSTNLCCSRLNCGLNSVALKTLLLQSQPRQKQTTHKKKPVTFSPSRTWTFPRTTWESGSSLAEPGTLLPHVMTAMPCSSNRRQEAHWEENWDPLALPPDPMTGLDPSEGWGGVVLGKCQRWEGALTSQPCASVGLFS